MRLIPRDSLTDHDHIWCRVTSGRTAYYVLMVWGDRTQPVIDARELCYPVVSESSSCLALCPVCIHGVTMVAPMTVDQLAYDLKWDSIKPDHLAPWMAASDTACIDLGETS